ncbi:DUF4928 family protein, partial [Ellagibacter isourolithinifaciens]|uniref:DUF4928 family protein n=1 Tax=Ellagibacter isourolithinifaciens TaxID=2137581 RepID=UPI003AADBCC4
IQIDYFAKQRMKIDIDPSKPVSAIVADILCAGYERLGGTSRVAKSAIMSNETAKGIFLHVTNSQLESSEHPSA